MPRPGSRRRQAHHRGWGHAESTHRPQRHERATETKTGYKDSAGSLEVIRTTWRPRHPAGLPMAIQARNLVLCRGVNLFSWPLPSVLISVSSRQKIRFRQFRKSRRSRVRPHFLTNALHAPCSLRRRQRSRALSEKSDCTEKGVRRGPRPSPGSPRQPSDERVNRATA